MDADGILQSISDNLPEVLLVVSGVMAVLIALTYVKRKESVLYKFLMVVGVVLGAVMIYESLTVGELESCITAAAGKLLRKINLFFRKEKTILRVGVFPVERYFSYQVVLALLVSICPSAVFSSGASSPTVFPESSTI